MKKKCFSDAHNHLSHVKDIRFINEGNFCCSSFHTKEEFESFADIPNVVKSFGVHPQNCNMELLDYVEELASSSRIDAVGECGFDLFTQGFKATLQLQIQCFERQVEIAAKYNLPLVLHIRKAIDLIFGQVKRLKKIPSLIFHSFPGTFMQTQALLKKGLNCYFSFGKPLLNGKKTALECVSKLSMDRILLETDAPYQTLKDEKFTKVEDIISVYEKVCEIRNISMEDLQEQTLRNFRKGFLVQ